jgi:adenylate cyclase
MLKKPFHIDQLVGLAMLAALLFISHMDPYPVKYIREKCFDIYQIIKPRTSSSPEDRLVVIIDVDEKSLQEIGQWPWSRKTIATLVANLHNMGVGVIAFDIVFSEADRLNPSSLLNVVENIDSDVRDTILALESNDEIFGRILAQTNVVLGRAGFWERHPNDSGKLIQQAIAVRSLSPNTPEPTDFLIDTPTLISNLPLLEKNAKGIGIFTFKPMLDGIVRQVPMVIQHKGNLYPSLAVEAVRVGLQISTLMLEVDPNGIRAVAIAPRSMLKPDGLKVVTDEMGLVRPYFSPHDPSLYLSASDVLNQRVDPSRLAGKIAFVGSSAAVLLDTRSTPIDSQVPGVEIHAQVVENMLALDGDTGAVVAADQFLSRSEFVSKGGEIIIIAIGGLLMILLTPILGAARSMVLFVVLTCTAMAGSWFLFSEKLVLMDATFAVTTSFILYSTLIFLSWIREEKSKRHIRGAFAKYLSPAMVDRVAEHPEQLKLGGERRDMTLLFCDIRGFTTISEQFSAEGLTRLINELLSPLTDVILKNGGTVDKYMGDCIMAFWNAPLDDPQHALNACISALQMLEKMDELNRRFQLEADREGGPHIELKVGLGLNSGECVVGNMGSDQRFDYSVLGDTVNMASRLEGQSKNYGVPIVIGENTRNQVPQFATFELDIVKVKGKTEAGRIFALIGDEKVAKSSEFQALKKAIDSMLSKWRSLDWNGAKAACAKARDLGKPYDIDAFFDFYDQRIIDFKACPPVEDWDGVCVATTK